MGSGEDSTMRKCIVCNRSPTIVRVIKSRILRWVGHFVRKEEARSDFNILTDTSPQKKPSGRPRRRRENKIRMDIKEIGINTRNGTNLAKGRDNWRVLVYAALNRWVS